jgi:hypothetical protein
MINIPKLLSKSKEPVDEVSVGYQPKPTLNKATFLLVFAVLLAGASFYEGAAFQRSADSSSANTTTAAVSNQSAASNAQNGMQTGFVRNHVIGQVAAISTTSITVQDQRSGDNTTLSVNGNTQIVINNQSATAGDIQTGDLVIVTKTSNSSSTASKIIVAPGTWNFGSSNDQQSSTTMPIQGLNAD